MCIRDSAGWIDQFVLIRDYDSWIAQFTVSDSSEQGDPDGDGTDNLVEYALGLDPTAHDTCPSPAVDLSGANPQVTIGLASGTTGITSEIQRSTDLTGWGTTGLNALPSATPTSLGVEDTNGDPRAFYRLRVTR